MIDLMIRSGAMLYGAIGILICALLWKWHADPQYKNFNLIDLVAEEGRISSRKFMEFGAWVTSTVAFIITVVKGAATTEWLLIYTSVFVLGRSIGQGIHAYQTKSANQDQVRVSLETTSTAARGKPSLLRGEEEEGQ